MSVKGLYTLTRSTKFSRSTETKDSMFGVEADEVLLLINRDDSGVIFLLQDGKLAYWRYSSEDATYREFEFVRLFNPTS